ncbi:MAG: S41 family peptidase [Patescibacteria group bacterium]
MNVPKTKKRFYKFLIGLVVLACLLFASFSSGYVFGKIGEGKVNLVFDPELYKEKPLTQIFDSSIFKQVYSIITNDFVDKQKIEEKNLYYGALKGMVDGVEDPYTVFFDPTDTASFDEQINGEFEGIGAQIGQKEDIIVIIAPLPGSPAEKAGLKSGDKIYAVDEKDIIGFSVDETIKVIRGPKGTEVKLLVVRGEEAPFEVKIVREVIVIESVKWNWKNDLLHIELQAFNADTSSLFARIYEEIKNKKPKGIILDMRGNPGGILETAVDLTSYWVDNNVVMVEKFGNGQENKYYTTHEAYFKDIPTVALIDVGSASGSEILAGALQDYGLAKLVGQKSFGKGSVQQVKRLPDGSSVKVTIAKWLTPQGRSIDEEGVKPDYEVEYTKDDFDKKIDPQLNKAIDLLKK